MRRPTRGRAGPGMGRNARARSSRRGHHAIGVPPADADGILERLSRPTGSPGVPARPTRRSATGSRLPYVNRRPRRGVRSRDGFTGNHEELCRFRKRPRPHLPPKRRALPLALLSSLVMPLAAAAAEPQTIPPSWRNIETGWVIPDESYADQPYIVKCDDGAWLCVITTAAGKEGITASTSWGRAVRTSAGRGRP